jgi:hypothetical protein
MLINNINAVKIRTSGALHAKNIIESINIRILKEMIFILISKKIIFVINTNKITILTTRHTLKDNSNGNNVNKVICIERKVKKITDLEIKISMLKILRNL